MSRTGISIQPDDPRQADIRGMIAESDAMMRALYPADPLSLFMTKRL